MPSVWRKIDCFWLPLNKHSMNIWLGSLRIREQENISMFSMCSELTPRAPIPDSRITQFMQPCSIKYCVTNYVMVAEFGHNMMWSFIIKIALQHYVSIKLNIFHYAIKSNLEKAWIEKSMTCVECWEKSMKPIKWIGLHWWINETVQSGVFTWVGFSNWFLFLEQVYILWNTNIAKWYSMIWKWNA